MSDRSKCIWIKPAAIAVLVAFAVLALKTSPADAQGQKQPGQGRQPVQAQPSMAPAGAATNPFGDRALLPTTVDDAGTGGDSRPFDETGKCEADEKGINGWLALLPELKAIREGVRTTLDNWDQSTGPDAKYFAHSQNKPREAAINKRKAKRALQDIQARFNASVVVENYQNAIINCEWCKIYNDWGRLLRVVAHSGEDYLRQTGTTTKGTTTYLANVPDRIFIKDLTKSQVQDESVIKQVEYYEKVNRARTEGNGLPGGAKNPKCAAFYNQSETVDAANCSEADALAILNLIRDRIMGALTYAEKPGETKLLTEWHSHGWPKNNQDYCQPAAVFPYFQDILFKSRNW